VPERFGLVNDETTAFLTAIDPVNGYVAFGRANIGLAQSLLV
jgi:hypothetical protein